LKRTPFVAVLILSALYFLLPLWWLIVSATKSNSGLFNSNGFWFAEPHLWENLVNTFTASGGVFPRWVLNSILYSGVAGAVGTLLAAGAGYVQGKFTFRGKQLLFGFVLAGVLVPNVLLTIPLYYVAASVGLTNNVLAVILPSCVNPFGVFL